MHRSYNKIHVIADSSPNAQAAKRSIIKKYKNYPINDSDVFIVLGGDGFMLASLKKYQKYKIPFYGMNKGNRGFLLNTPYSIFYYRSAYLHTSKLEYYFLELRVRMSA